MNQRDVDSLMERNAHPNAALPPVRSEPLLANETVVRAMLDRLLQDAEHRWGCTAEIPREEILTWLDTRTVHWFANAHPGAPDYLLEAYKRGCRDERAAAKVRNDDEVQRLMGILRRQEICPACGETTFDGDCTCPNEKAEG